MFGYIAGTQMRYLGNDINILSLEAMKNMFEIPATNLKIAREKGDPENNPLPTKLQPGETVLVQTTQKDHLTLTCGGLSSVCP